MMNIVLGRIPENPDFDPPSQGWTAIKEPSPWYAQLMAFPIGLIITVLLGILWYTAAPFDGFDVDDIGGSALLWLAGIVVCHEFIHALFHPGCGTSANTYFGFWPSKLLFYAHYDSIISKRRFIVILIAPFVFISIVPLLFCAAFQCASMTICGVSLLNALCAAMDVFGCFLIFWSVPPGALTRNKGWKTYYRMAEPRTGPDGVPPPLC